MSARDGGSAFPVPELVAPNTGDLVPACQQGISVRDYFMAHAPITLADAIEQCGWSCADKRHFRDKDRAVLFAIMALMRSEYADAMIAERERTK